MLENADSNLTPIQRGMVFHHLIDAHAGVDVEQIVITLRGFVDATNLLAAWSVVINAHPVLHSRVVECGANDYRLVADRQFKPALAEVELAGSGSAALAEWLGSDRARGFELPGPVPLRLTLLREPGAAARCVWSFHHILLDGRSFADVLVDVLDAYDALLAGQAPQVPPRPDAAPFLDWLRNRDQAPSLAYWRRLLAGHEQADAFGSAGPPAATGGRRVLERHLDAEFSASVQDWIAASDATPNCLVQAAWATLLARYTDQESVVFGAVRAGRAGHVADARQMLGVFINTLPVRADVAGRTGSELVRALRVQQLEARAHEHTPLAQIQAAAGVAGELALFQTLLVFDNEPLDASVHRMRPDWSDRDFELHEQTIYPVTLYAYGSPRLNLKLAWSDAAFTGEQAGLVLDHLVALLHGIVAEPGVPVRQLAMLTVRERRLIEEFNRSDRAVAPTTIQAAFEQAVDAHPERAALRGAGKTLSYAQLDSAAASVAAELASRGVGRGQVVGLSLDRSVELVVAMLGILKAGAAYLPLDPEYPIERLESCVRDSGIEWVLTQRRHAHVFQRGGIRALHIEDMAGNRAPTRARAPGAPDDLAYLIYTSGSTGRPKGVLVSQANVVNFFAGMDAVIDVRGEKRWLAVTSVSFDISVLELLWTLTRGFEVVLHGARSLADDGDPRGPSFSLFHFASGMDASDPDPYRLILEAARFADQNGFEAVWSPERHFHDFGAPYPNPALMNAALATATSRVQLRAGSVVLPLHNPLYVVEDWSLVDRLSGGRVGVSFASGWQPNDFVLAPGNYERRKELMFEQIQTVRALWRGERIQAHNPKGDQVWLGTYPRPVQPELPVWITAAGSPDTFRQAGAIGANLLTHMLGQSPADLAINIGHYRQARAAQGLDPLTGRVTVMVHTFVGEDTAQVRDLVREPMKRYLASAASLVGSYADAWSAYKRGAGGPVQATAMSELSAEELGELYEFAFERYFETSGLFGSVEKCLPLLQALDAAGVDEIACLIDFGVAAETVIAHLPFIRSLKDRMRHPAGSEDEDIVHAIEHNRISHLQCTPSQARTIPMLARSPAALGSLRQVLVGGEMLAPDLVRTLQALLPSTTGLVNMYGPTETTIWSTCEQLARDPERVGIGTPLANTRCYILDAHRQQMPPGCVGELHIGGDGVARGYHARPELTAERFFEFRGDGASRRVYATGDRARLASDGRLECLGRNDTQVKVRGHRVELGEIEAALRAEPGVSDAVVVTRQDSVGSQQLIAYVVADGHAAMPDTEALRLGLRRRLPEPMLPGVFVWLRELPLTPNGKIDRRALPAPTAPVLESCAGETSANSETEQTIRGIWQSVLGLEHVGLRDNFFELGGHSILAVKAQSELSRAFGRRLPIAELFRSPTIESLARHFSTDAPVQGGDTAVRAADRARQRRVALGRRSLPERPRP